MCIRDRLQGTQLHRQRVLPDHHTGGEEEPTVRVRQQEVARFSGQDPQSA